MPYHISEFITNILAVQTLQHVCMNITKYKGSSFTNIPAYRKCIYEGKSLFFYKIYRWAIQQLNGACTYVRTAKTRIINLHIRKVWSEFSLFVSAIYISLHGYVVLNIADTCYSLMTWLINAIVSFWIILILRYWHVILCQLHVRR